MASLDERISIPDAGDDSAQTTVPDDNGQLDGSTSYAGGSSIAQPQEYEVEVKLIDENSPLYSVKSFEELGLYAQNPYLPVQTLMFDQARRQ